MHPATRNVVIVAVAALVALGVFTASRLSSGAPALADALGPRLIARNGREVAVEDVTSRAHVLVYFSAHWCGPCRQFTPQLVKLHETYRKQRDFEVVFVSFDRSQDEMMGYMKEARMPWPAVPFAREDLRRKLGDAYGARGIPHLVLLDAAGKVLSSSVEGGRYVGPNKVIADFHALSAKR